MSFKLKDLLPSIFGLMGSGLAKGDPTKYAPQQTPQQLAAYTQLLQMLMRKNQMGSDPMNQLRAMFYGQQQAPKQTLVGLPGPPPSQPRPY